MHGIDELKERAAKVRDKKAALGPDIDLEEFDKAQVPHQYLVDEELCALPEEEQQRLVMAGLDLTKKERGGTFFQKDTTVIHCDTRQEGVELMPIRRALEDHEWIRDYYWRLVQVDMDKYTAAAELDLHDGYVIRALPGSKSIYPIQACLYLDKEGLQQTLHHIIIAEEDSELHIITGCSTSPHLKRGVHLGISEFFVKRNAKLSFTMIHNWAEGMLVRPRSVAQVEAGGLFLNNYICMKPVRSIQMYPTTHLMGEGSVARFYSIIVGSPGSEHDVGGRIFLKKPGSRAEIITRTISNGGKIIARGHLIGEKGMKENGRTIPFDSNCRAACLPCYLLLCIQALIGGEIDRRSGQQKFPEPSRVREVGLDFPCRRAAPNEKPVWSFPERGFGQPAETKGVIFHGLQNFSVRKRRMFWREI